MGEERNKKYLKYLVRTEGEAEKGKTKGERTRERKRKTYWTFRERLYNSGTF
jgi:hypothetical protein